MSDLIQFLRARLDEDEHAAESRRKIREYFGRPCPMCDRPVTGIGSANASWAAMTLLHQESTTLGCEVDRATWDEFGDDGPTDECRRILRDVDAKRRIIALHEPVSISPGHPHFNDGHLTSEPMTICGSCEPAYADRRAKSWPCPTLHALALPYAGHPDYQADWRP